MSYWTFSDIFKEPGPPLTPFHGGFGLLNLQGICKPAYIAYKYLHELGSQELQNTDAASWATTDAAGNVQVLFVKEHPAPAAGTVTLALRNLPAGRYTTETCRVGYGQNDACTAYLKLGRLGELTRQQVADLQKLTKDAPLVNSPSNVGANGLKVNVRQATV